jgi:hypothetical protein
MILMKLMLAAGLLTVVELFELLGDMSRFEMARAGLLWSIVNVDGATSVKGSYDP